MLTITISRPLVWLWRFRHRRGYGVHSPFAFDFITNVVYEHTPYYKYDELNEQVARQEAALGHAWSHREPLRLKQLLFRMVNRAQPARIIHIGPPSAIGLYLQAGKQGAHYTEVYAPEDLQLGTGTTVDFLYIDDTSHPAAVEAAFARCAAQAGPQSVFVLRGVGYTHGMREAWKRLRQHPDAVVTFDLYDVGIVFFDPSKNRQHYVVNF